MNQQLTNSSLSNEKQTTGIVFLGSSRIPDYQTAKKNVAQLQNTKQLDKSLWQLKYSKYQEQAIELAAIIATNTRETIITGAGAGFMAAAQKGASLHGGKHLGMLVIDKELPNEFCKEHNTIWCESLSLRKIQLLQAAKAIAIFPGGFGTLDELFTALVLIQNHELAKIPIVLLGKQFWERALNLPHLLAAGTINLTDLNCIKHVENATAAWEIIRPVCSLK